MQAASDVEVVGALSHPSFREENKETIGELQKHFN